MIRLIVPPCLAVAMSTVALAHPGDHSHFSANEMLVHISEPTHAALVAAIVALVGVLAWRGIRRSHAQARKASRMSRRDWT